MNFDELHELVPYARFGKAKSLTMTPYKNITLAMPGRHAEDCSPKGGDFVVMVTDTNMNWKRHQFKHSDIFQDIQTKVDFDPIHTRALLNEYFRVVARNAEPDAKSLNLNLPGINPVTFLHAAQCLAVAEHRRYHMHEAKFGGRFLPLRFVAGIAEGLWTADKGAEVQKYGRPAVERLEKTNGRPVLTEHLMNTTP